MWPSTLGIFLFLGIAVLLSEKRSKIPWRGVLIVIVVEFLLAGIVLRVDFATLVFQKSAMFFAQVMRFAEQGSGFVFSHELMSDHLTGQVLAGTAAEVVDGAALPPGPADANGSVAPVAVRVAWPFVFAIRVLPAIIFFSALIAILYHLGVMQRVIEILARLLTRIPGVSNVEALSVAANVFVGQTEAPLVVHPYIQSMSRSQVMTLMTGGFATIAGSTIFAYAGLLAGDDGPARTDFIRHLLTASVMSAPAAILMAKIIVPPDGAGEDAPIRAELPLSARGHGNILDSMANGATAGLSLAANIAAMLIAFVALLHMVDWPLSALGTSLSSILGWLFTPFAYAMGIVPEDAQFVGSLLGEKLIATELVAFKSLGQQIQAGQISARSAAISSYALCGFANFASVAIQVGALRKLAPKQSAVSSLAVKAMFAGALSSWMTASVVSFFL